MIYPTIIRPLLFRMDPETAHDITYTAARVVAASDGISALTRGLFAVDDVALQQDILGLRFRNPVGLAAGFDKNGHLPHAIHAIGFGYTEVGSITARPSKGNPKPRVFRLPLDNGLINRMGLNNDGAEAILARLRAGARPPFPVGINIAKTHNPAILGDDAIRDYLISFNLAQSWADYIHINISCPNTEEGKTFEDPAALSELLSEISIVRKSAIATTKRIPVFVKFSADLDRESLELLLEITERFGIDAYAAVNTSALRTGLSGTSTQDLSRFGRGGLSGKPLRERSLRVVRWIRDFTNSTKPIIGIGGIFSADDAVEALRSGASLVQIYTGLIYGGPSLPGQINKGIVKWMRERQLQTIQDIRTQYPL